ncbi:Tyrosine--tRNA ligase [Anatilimnocola aggregata]|uniref:Tyrosine--tRNA ligase n=1 Tax=Anatilimnocola aggregata TaxID=2528021 RepID=A0A517YLK8_9BACT|nr:tyrosine--tRNA ligase [Anatilimnocola aggregata]QDU31093.1 Tyrosine--tRNA ligase [Anatilimnocola aggregata]
MSLFADLTWRGLVNQTTADEHLPQWLNSGSRTVYCGFDPTSDSLHVGSLLPVMLLRRFQKAGHRPIALVGGATGMVGDPTGKTDERKLLDADSLRTNVAGIRSQLERFIDFGDGKSTSGAMLVNNFDWMGGISYLEFLRDVGKHFPVNIMLAKDSVKGRLERDSGISYTEFSYMLLQAYDFVVLKRRHGCDLQIGGSDQWGNITAGIDLARRMDSVQLYGMTCPLLLKSDGTKMGKSEKGAVYLDAAKTSPYAFYQYWINLADADAGMALRFLTELAHEEIEALDAQRIAEAHKRDSQKRLAEELTRLVHGEAGLAAARKATEIFFGAEIENLSDSELTEIFADVPNKQLSPSILAGEGLPLIDALVESGLCKSKGDARRVVDQGGAYVNNRRQNGVDTKLTTAQLASETVMVLRSGKKNYALLRFV